ncbi:hypothetical protein SAMN03159293_00022 [Pseudomonas sp. NFACC39-1]|nr:hypothetical protein SAMN03159293_00022 [Pseudomonas sp. NFACC39-1]
MSNLKFNAEPAVKCRGEEEHVCRPDPSQVFLSRGSLVVCRSFANASIHSHIRTRKGDRFIYRPRNQRARSLCVYKINLSPFRSFDSQLFLHQLTQQNILRINSFHRTVSNQNPQTKLGVKGSIKNKTNLTCSRIKSGHNFHTLQRNQTPHIINCKDSGRLGVNLISIKTCSVFLKPTKVIVKNSFFYQQRNSDFV